MVGILKVNEEEKVKNVLLYLSQLLNVKTPALIKQTYCLLSEFSVSLSAFTDLCFLVHYFITVAQQQNGERLMRILLLACHNTYKQHLVFMAFQMLDSKLLHNNLGLLNVRVSVGEINIHLMGCIQICFC